MLSQGVAMQATASAREWIEHDPDAGDRAELRDLVDRAESGDQRAVDDLDERVVRLSAAAHRDVELLPALRPGQHRVGGVDRDPLSAVHRHRVAERQCIKHLLGHRPALVIVPTHPCECHARWLAIGAINGLRPVLDGLDAAKAAVLQAPLVQVAGTQDRLAEAQAIARAIAEFTPVTMCANQADFGVALDGDADRLQIVDASGRLYNGDELLYLMAAERLARDEHVPGVVGTLMTNMAVEQALTRRGVKFVRAKVGDRYVLEELQRQNWLLGGEGSGHLLALDCHTTGDGLISALQVLQACVRSQKTLAELLADVPLFPQVLLNVRLKPDQDWKANAALADTTREVQAELADNGRLLVRASGTEPLLRVMVEARDADQASRCAQRLADAARAA